MRRAPSALSLFAALGLVGAGCSEGGGGSTAVDMAGTTALPPAWRASLDVDIRDRVDVVLVPDGTGGLDVELTLQSGGAGVVAPMQVLRARGRLEKIPEGRTELYVAKLAGAAIATGPCGAKPVSLALSLARREGNDRVAGGLAAYCGENVWSGVPVRMLRLSGKLPFVP